MNTLSQNKKDAWLPWFLKGILIVGFLVIIGRIFELQIIKSGYYKSLAEGNRIRRVILPAPRGNIITSDNQTIAQNKEIKMRIVFNEDGSYRVTDDLTQAKEEEVISTWLRYYPKGEAFAPITGYIGEVGEDEVGKSDPSCTDKGGRKLGGIVGRMGLEAEYNCVLTGVDGEELIEVDTMGRPVRVLGRKDPVAGKDLYTAVNSKLQMKAFELMKDKVGGIVAEDAAGKVKVLVSSPSYDPNIFVLKNKQEAVKKLLDDPENPLFDRTVSGLYHPGSVFKPLVALAGLDGVIDESYLFDDPGVLVVKTAYGDFSYANWYFTQYGAKEGEINIVRALTRSTDTFFYNLGELIGIDGIVDWSRKLGLDKPVGIDLPGDAPGFIPDPRWKEKEKGEKWFVGDTYNISIGQGDLLLTPLLVTKLTSTVALDGVSCTPRLVGDQECVKIDISKDNLEIVKKGMAGVCTTGGTGYTFFDFNPLNLSPLDRIGCKTGTAEVGDGKTTHAWFTLFSPVINPEIIATVLVEKGGEGSTVAGPIAKDLVDYYYKIK